MGSLRISKNYALRSAGQLLARVKTVDQRLESLRIAYENSNTQEASYLLGKISGLRDHRTSSHKDMVDSLVSTRQDIRDAIDFNEEQAFLKGYLDGIEIALQIDREVYTEDVNFIIFVYSESEELLNKYRLVFRSIDAFSELSGKGLQYYLSSNADDICSNIERHQSSNQFITVVLYDAHSLPSVDTMQALASDRLECIYLHKDSEEDNIGKLIYKLLVKTCT